MANMSLASQLDDAIEMMIAEPNYAPPSVDPNLGELLGIAAGLRLLPDPEFRMRLKVELLGQDRAVPLVSHADRRRKEEGYPGSQAKLDPILPTLFGEGDGTYPVQRSNFAISLAIHGAMIAAVATAGLWMTKPQLTPHTSSVLLTDLSTFALPASSDRSGGGGGGGDNDRLSESKGNLPRFAREQTASPAIVVRNELPMLPEEPTLVGPPALTVPSTSPVGNPLSAILQSSNGVGSGGGIGNSTGGGVGSGYGPGFGPGYGGGTGGGVYRVGGGVSAPHAIYDPEPEYSEEARRAKYQGSVLLSVIVGADGGPRNIRVARSLGMGLDEKAIEAVTLWRFQPSMLNGSPVAVQVNIEVSFRLY